eukprot:GSA25T00026160001.1
MPQIRQELAGRYKQLENYRQQESVHRYGRSTYAKLLQEYEWRRWREKNGKASCTTSSSREQQQTSSSS